MAVIDISALTFEEWLLFLFDHPVESSTWYSSSKFAYDINDEEKIVDYLTQLFKNPGLLIEKFSEVQLEQGFWFLLGSKGFIGLLWNPEIEFSKRKECIHSMYDLYQLLFWKNPFPTISFMWWDLLTQMYDLHDGQPQDDDDARIQEEMFQVMCKLLDTTNPVQAKSALHGLGHIKHAKSKDAIDQYLMSHPEISDELKNYAAECKEGSAE